MPQTKQQTIAQQVEAAGLQPLRNTAKSDGSPTATGVRSLGSLVEDILTGEIKPAQIDDEIRAWLNARIDIPYVPDSLEDRAFDLAVRALKSAIIELV